MGAVAAAAATMAAAFPALMMPPVVMKHPRRPRVGRIQTPAHQGAAPEAAGADPQNGRYHCQTVATNHQTAHLRYYRFLYYPQLGRNRRRRLSLIRAIPRRTLTKMVIRRQTPTKMAIPRDLTLTQRTTATLPRITEYERKLIRNDGKQKMAVRVVRSGRNHGD